MMPRSAVELGYLTDPYAAAFVRGAERHAVPAPALRSPTGSLGSLYATSPHRRPPLINRGTYARINAFDRVLELFLKSKPQGEPAQVVSLGAGTDTRYFRFASKFASEQWAGLRYFELDLQENVLK